MKTKTYHGHPSYAHWNVALWFGNDEGLYNTVRESRSGSELWETLQECGYTRTADGVELNLRLVQYGRKAVLGD